MCGIFGYVGQPADLGQSLTAALKTLEYRGYDSWGIAIGDNGHILIEKQVGRINGAAPDFPLSTIGFGHTRWATHGGVTRANAHPHLDAGGRIAVIHNGIIENDQELRAALTERGHRFRSETDSEIVAFLIGEDVAAGFELVAAVARAFQSLHGLNAVIAMDARGGQIVAAKNVSPLVAGVGAKGVTIASDALALHPHADQILYLEDHHLVQLDARGLSLFERHTLDQLPVPLLPLERTTHNLDLGQYRHFMLKEIAEQPAVLEQIAVDSADDATSLAAAIQRHRATVLTGCGSAGYAALSGTYLFGQVGRRQLPALVGSEVKYHRHLLSQETLVVALSQSGETADLIEAATLAKQAGSTLAALINVERSTLDRLVDVRFPLRAGPEQCVLATKSYLAKVAALVLTAAALNGTLADGQRLVSAASSAIDRLLQGDLPRLVEETASRIVDHDHLFVIGRGPAYPSALEAALKIKEASYIHAEAFVGGELKHGVIALVESGTPCLVIAPNDETRADIITGATELKSRGGFIIGISPNANPVFDVHLAVDDLGMAAPLVNAVPAQLLAYHLAVLRGHDPDRPRNLAKSVTVK